VDCDSIGELLCKRAEKLNAAVLLMAKHKRGAVKEFFIGRWGKPLFAESAAQRALRRPAH
jgi:hypothetical protein